MSVSKYALLTWAFWCARVSQIKPIAANKRKEIFGGVGIYNKRLMVAQQGLVEKE